MSHEELELLKAKWEGRNRLLQTLMSGSKDLILAMAAVYTIWVQQENSGKIEVAAQTAASTNAITTQWWAERTGKPQDEAKAAAAVERLESVMP